MKNKRKIVFVIGIYPLFKGGAEYQMRLIADELKNEFEIVFLYLGDVPDRRVEETRVEVIDNYKTYFIKSPTKFDSLTLKYTYGRRIYEVLKKEKPDFVYQRVLKFMSYYISKYQKKMGYQHLIHIADLFTLDFKLDSLRGKFNYHFFRKTVKNKPKFIVQTTEQEEKLSKLGVKSDLQVYNIHPPVHSSIKEYIEQKVKISKKHIVWIANIRPIKQLEYFIAIAEKYKDNSDYTFTVIGGILDKGYAVPLLKEIETLPNMEFVTDKDNSFINQFILEKASLVINTSSSEGLSNVFIQSWMRGVPVVSLNSNPDDLFGRFPAFGIYCADNETTLLEAVYQTINNIDYKKHAYECFIESEKLFSVGNISKIKNILTK